MMSLLRVLLVEDSEDDAALVLRALGKRWSVIDSARVFTADAMQVALAARKWDVVIADWSMPSFSAPAAYALFLPAGLDIPFIIVSGTVGEEVAVEAMRSGVHDYVLKGNLARLAPAVERELREAAVRQERRAMQEQLLVADRLASLGTLAAGVAHEINNPLASIVANQELMTRELAGLIAELASAAADKVDVLRARMSHRLAEMTESLADACQGAARVREIVRDVQLFAHADAAGTNAVDVHRVIDSSIRMLQNEIRHRARLVRNYSRLRPVIGNEARLGQVFLNLIRNAAQSIDEGDVEANEIRVSTWLDDHDRAVIEVRDTGRGIPAEKRLRIFDPFFTTRPVGSGIGLGLAICHRILTELGGTISIATEVGAGTTVRVTLATADSISSAATPVEPDTLAGAAPAPGRRGTILVVDDEALVTSAVCRVLCGQHDVEATTVCADALSKIASGRRYDLILCDLLMPEMSGMELHEKIARIDPAQAARIVFMSGGTFTADARDFLERMPNPHLDKPFGTDQLRARVNQLIGKSP